LYGTSFVVASGYDGIYGGGVTGADESVETGEVGETTASWESDGMVISLDGTDGGVLGKDVLQEQPAKAYTTKRLKNNASNREKVLFIGAPFFILCRAGISYQLYFTITADNIQLLIIKTCIRVASNIVKIRNKMVE